MCGVAGILQLSMTAAPPEREALLRMAAALRHRGPDEFGLYRDARAGLAHARLSVIDVACGHQPLSNRDGSVWIAFNGEIFNYIELRDELIGLGYAFSTHSDTEVIVHAFSAWGEDAFTRMNGQWALALWQPREQRLTLARDRLGVRPLHVCRHAGRLYFASEVKSIFAADASIPRALDPEGIDETFTFWSPVAPRTAFAGVEELRPGHLQVYERGSMRERAYWQPSFPQEARREGQFGGSIEDAAHAVLDSLRAATRLRALRADVPVGSYLSGGLDSSLIAALAREASSAKLRTFSLRFADAEYDETSFQRLMAQRLASEHREIVVTRADIAEAFPAAVYHAERPILRTAPVPLLLLSRLTQRSGIKVVMTGEGADEVFAGYDLFREGKVRRFWARHPESALRPRLLERLYPYLQRSPVAQQAMARQFFGRNLEAFASPGFAHATRWRTTSALKRMFSPALRAVLAGQDNAAALLAALPAEFGRWSALAQDQYLEMRTLLAGYLLSSQGDRMLMASSVEGRFPFLDRDVVALAQTLPDRYKLRALDEKHVLKRAARGLVPREILERVKQPYRAPDALAFVASARPRYLDELLAPASIADAGVFDPKAVDQLWKKCIGRTTEAQFSNADNMALVGVLSTQVLHERFVRRRPVEHADLPLTVDHDSVLETCR
ncbi:MAG TPA: asparagine synthase (glutamine-hydrolyzing) [Burkholderiales bacterium]|nr:asparagine synthase (glutamine-hydrolyzing) [Burkholderiales bacterium]